MSTQALILGSGVSAGLAANILSRQYDLTLATILGTPSSPIPEILPRRTFFDALGVSAEEECEAVAAVAPKLETVRWVRSGDSQVRSLRSTSDYLVYEKGCLAAWLISRAKTLGVSINIDNTFQSERTLHKREVIFDCRGRKAVADDDSYVHQVLKNPATHCTYAIVRRPEKTNPGHMEVLSSVPVKGVEATLFAIPIGAFHMSIGLSYRSDISLTTSDVFVAAHAHLGLDFSVQDIHTMGTARPSVIETSTREKHRYPLGETERSTCPLYEYGVMASLSRILTFSGMRPLPESALLRPSSSEVDPHVPRELFV